MSNENKGLGAPAASQHRVTDAPHEAASASSPSGSVPTGAVAFTGPWSFRYYMDPVGRHHDNFHLFEGPEGDQGSTILEGAFVIPGTHSDALKIARLIAAAPELYEACAEFVRKVDAGEAKSTRSYEQMKAALAKARGHD